MSLSIRRLACAACLFVLVLPGCKKKDDAAAKAAEPALTVSVAPVLQKHRLLLDVIAGRLNLFVRADEQEAAWHWVEPIMQAWAEQDARGEGPRPYAAGSWGPSAASALVAREGHTWMEEC